MTRLYSEVSQHERGPKRHPRLTNASRRHGGAPMTLPLELSGKSFGRLKAIEVAPLNKRRRYWRCTCECGAEAIIEASKLISGHSKSCGCLLADKNRALRQTHAHASKSGRSPTYKTYTNMITRCENPRAINYSRYGGAGITVCSRWRFGEGGLSGFECFLEDMGERPSASHSIDRELGAIGYEPSNCRWSLGRTQVLNRGNTIMVDVGGYEVPLAVACELTGIRYGTAWSRMKKGNDWRGIGQ